MSKKIMTFTVELLHNVGDRVVVAEKGTRGQWRKATVTDVMVSYRVATNSFVTLYHLNGGKYVRLEK